MINNSSKLNNYEKILKMSFEEFLDCAVWRHFCEDMRSQNQCKNYTDCRECRKAWLLKSAD